MKFGAGRIVTDVSFDKDHAGHCSWTAQYLW